MTDRRIRTLFAISLSCLALPAQAQIAPVDDPVKALVGRLDLEKYKAIIKDLARFGDRQQGTDRNKAAVDWIVAQLRSYGCTNTERFKYVSDPPPQSQPRTGTVPAPAIASGEIRRGVGGSRLRGMTRPTTVNTNLDAQSDPKLRALNAQPQPTTAGPREQVYCTKVGSRHPDEMYIVGAHMDGQGFGEAADDDGSGTALVMELARIFSSPDVQTDRSIRFVLWNNEEAAMPVPAPMRHGGHRCRERRIPPARADLRNRSGSGWSSMTWCCGTMGCLVPTAPSARNSARKRT